MAEVKSGTNTTEFKAAKSGSVWGIIAMILGTVMAVGTPILDALGTDANSTVGIIAGTVIAIAGILQKTFSDLGYISSRTEVKKASANE